METAWNAVLAHGARLRSHSLRALFAEDAERFARFSRRLGDLTVDFSKEKIDAPALAALLALARAADVEGRRDALFAGAPVNETENRAALHVAARDPDRLYDAEGADEVAPVLARFLDFAEAVRAGAAAPSEGGRFTDVISIGIGGSDLGPAMAVRALAPFADGPRLHFIANVDGADFTDATRGLDPARTLVIVQSKTFATAETMANAATARGWLAARLGENAVPAHLAAVSANPEAAAAFGVARARVFGFRDWIGGRYSIWSAIGLPLAIAVGAARFRDFLSGGRAMDAHFREAPLEANLPALLGLVGVWRRNALGCGSVAVIPYEHRLARFPAYLQQLTMESNGKGVTRGGAPVPRATCPVVWGEPGTNAQHSFFQMLHQGPERIPVDFLLGAEPTAGLAEHHASLVANGLAQSKALAFGRTEDEIRAAMAAEGAPPEAIDRLAPHRVCPGDRPSTTLLYRRLDPETLGRLIALYEHKTFVESVLWDVNPFDQWGVELGKTLATSLRGALDAPDAAEEDASTRGLLGALRAMRRPGGS